MATTHLRVSAEDRRQQIIDVATDLFARQGFEGTTTRQVAEAAGVNEAIIFRHFPTKEDLYWAIIEHKCHSRGENDRVAEKLQSGGSDLEIFSGIAEEILSRDTKLTRLLLFCALEKHELTHRFFRTHVAQRYELVGEYIAQGIREGRFREIDPILAARSFFGMVFYQFQVQELFGGKDTQRFDKHEMSRTLAEVWLQGMRPCTTAGQGLGHNGHKAKSEKVKCN